MIRLNAISKKAVAMVMTASMVLALAACSSGSGSTAATTAAAETEAAETTAAESAAAETEAASEASGETEAAAAGGVLRVAMECAYAPYNWTQSDDSNGAVPINDSKDYAYGYDVMMAKKIAGDLGMELQIVKSDWDSLIPALQSNKVDCVIAGQSITSERLQTVDFSKPYYYASIVTLTKKDSSYANATGISGLAGGTCTSQQNTI